MRRALLFVNLKASQTEACAEEIVKGLTEEGLVVERAEAHGVEDYSKRLREHAGCVDLLVVAGGDGRQHFSARRQRRSR